MENEKSSGTGQAQEKKLRIVVIDDEKFLSDLLSSAIEASSRFDLLAVRYQGQEGLAVCMEQKPDLVVVDLMLPGMGAPAFAVSLLDRLPQTRILVMSSSRNENALLGILSTGVHGFFDKLEPLDHFIHAIEEVGAGRSYYSSSVMHLIPKILAHQPTQQGRLTPRQLEILQLVAEGMSNKQIAASLRLSIRTVENHRRSLQSRLGVRDVAAMTRMAIRMGLLNA